MREAFVLEEQHDDGSWEPDLFCVYEDPRDAAPDIEANGRVRVTRYVPDDEVGDAFAMIVGAGCQGGVFTEGGSWVCRLTNERGDSSSGYGPLDPAGQPQPGARQAVLMAIEKFPRGVR
jgi:hypothetical protein